jgi:hypothetical protein
MRRRWFVIGAALLLIAGCSSSKKAATPSTTIATTSSTASATTTSVGPTTSSVPASTVSSTPVTHVVCPERPLTTVPVSASNGSASLLTGVTTTHDACTDTVTFDFRAKTPKAPSYTITYSRPPFSEDASGAPVMIAGNAFITVKVKPGYGYDFETGTRTYTGSPRITPTGAVHLTEIVETGDYEGVLTWVIGMRTKEAFTVTATGAPHPQLSLRIG